MCSPPAMSSIRATRIHQRPAFVEFVDTVAHKVWLRQSPAQDKYMGVCVCECLYTCSFAIWKLQYMLCANNLPSHSLPPSQQYVPLSNWVHHWLSNPWCVISLFVYFRRCRYATRVRIRVRVSAHAKYHNLIIIIIYRNLSSIHAYWLSVNLFVHSVNLHKPNIYMYKECMLWQHSQLAIWQSGPFSYIYAVCEHPTFQFVNVHWHRSKTAREEKPSFRKMCFWFSIVKLIFVSDKTHFVRFSISVSGVLYKFGWINYIRSYQMNWYWVTSFLFENRWTHTLSLFPVWVMCFLLFFSIFFNLC